MHYGTNLDEIVDNLMLSPAEINEHLYTLKGYAGQCDHVTEFGVSFGRSTAAFLAARPKVLRSYDVRNCLPLGWWPEGASLGGLVETDWKFTIGDSREIDIDETDLLFIDTWHVYECLKAELDRHQAKVRKWILLHDTVLYREMNRAIYELLERERTWTIAAHHWNNNGLMILERR